jgi:Zn-dependent protease
MGNLNLIEIGAKIGMWFVPFLFALCFHEYAHGWVARLRGDHTAERLGRLTLNPIAHMDILGTLILPLAAILFGFPFFGWAKPVPIDSRNLKNPKTDMFWVALAGPLSNVLLAVVSALVLFPVVAIGFHGQSAGKALEIMLDTFILINLFLAVFNLIPLHPLDGQKVFERFLPYTWNRWLEMNQTILSWGMILIFLLGGFGFLAKPVFFLKDILMSFGTHIALMFI